MRRSRLPHVRSAQISSSSLTSLRCMYAGPGCRMYARLGFCRPLRVAACAPNQAAACKLGSDFVILISLSCTCSDPGCMYAVLGCLFICFAQLHVRQSRLHGCFALLCSSVSLCCMCAEPGCCMYARLRFRHPLRLAAHVRSAWILSSFSLSRICAAPGGRMYSLLGFCHPFA